jgi:hypothetical protein
VAIGSVVGHYIKELEADELSPTFTLASRIFNFARVNLMSSLFFRVPLCSLWLLLNLAVRALALSSGTITVDSNGTALAYTDSGIPVVSSNDYPTMFAVHGLGFSNGRSFLPPYDCLRGSIFFSRFQKRTSPCPSCWGTLRSDQPSQLPRQHTVLRY